MEVTDGHHDDGDERSGNLLVQTGHQGDDADAEQTHQRTPEVNVSDVAAVGNPFLNEVGGILVHRHAQQVLDLCGEDGDGDTAGETHNNRVGNVFDDGTQPEDA